jgi:hypothetical protein
MSCCRQRRIGNRCRKHDPVVRVSGDEQIFRATFGDALLQQVALEKTPFSLNLIAYNSALLRRTKFPHSLLLGTNDKLWKYRLLGERPLQRNGH